MPRAQSNGYNRKKPQAGFTLVETLAAFTILAISLIAIYRAFSTGITGSGKASELAQLALEAQSKMTELIVIAELIPDGIERRLENENNWTVTVRPASELFGNTHADVQVWLVELTGTSKSGQKVTLHSYRLGRLGDGN